MNRLYFAVFALVLSSMALGSTEVGPAAGGGIKTYANAGALPTSNVKDGATGITLDNHSFYIYNLGTTTWLLQVTGTNPAIGGPLTGATAGSVLFAGAGAFAQDNAHLFWDDTNNRLGIGTNAPSSNLHVVGTTTLQSTDDGNSQALVVKNNSGVDTLTTRGFGDVNVRTALWIGGYNGDNFLANGTFGVLSSQGVGNSFFTVKHNDSTAAINIKSNSSISLQEAGGSVGIGTTTPAATLEVAGTAKIGSSTQVTVKADGRVRFVNMNTATRNAVASPERGDTIYNTDTEALEFYDGTAWN